MKFRSLRADEIKVRVDRIIDKGAILLLYKDARVDMDVLDETVHPENWQRKHYERKGNMFCSVGININFGKPDAPQEWVWKDDAGTESYTAKEKGESSDSFKRACINWGIGRELYSAPFIFVSCKTKQKDKSNSYELEDKKVLKGIYVSQVKTENGRIKEIAIVGKDGNVIYSNVGESVRPIDPTEPDRKAVDVKAKINKVELKALKDRLDDMSYSYDEICTLYDIDNLADMNKSQLINCNAQLNRIAANRKKGINNG